MKINMGDQDPANKKDLVLPEPRNDSDE